MGYTVADVSIQCDENHPICERESCGNANAARPHADLNVQDVEKASENACIRNQTAPNHPREARRADHFLQIVARILPPTSSTQQIKIDCPPYWMRRERTMIQLNLRLQLACRQTLSTSQSTIPCRPRVRRRVPHSLMIRSLRPETQNTTSHTASRRGHSSSQHILQRAQSMLRYRKTFDSTFDTTRTRLHIIIMPSNTTEETS